MCVRVMVSVCMLYVQKVNAFVIYYMTLLCFLHHLPRPIRVQIVSSHTHTHSQARKHREQKKKQYTHIVQTENECRIEWEKDVI